MAVMNVFTSDFRVFDDKMDIWISGFRSIFSAAASFPSGVSTLTGRSGSGKTTLITALCWILYGASGTGPHRATKIQSIFDLAPAGALCMTTTAGLIVAVRVVSGKHGGQLPSWIPPYATLAITSHRSGTVLECLWVNGVLVNFQTERDRLFGTHHMFTSTAIVPQKLPSSLLTTGKLSQTIQEFFFPADGPSCPDTYTNQLKEIGKMLKTELAMTQGQRSSANDRVSRAVAVVNNSAKYVVFGEMERSPSATCDDILAYAASVSGMPVNSPPAIENCAKTINGMRQKYRTEMAAWEGRKIAAETASASIPNVQPAIDMRRAALQACRVALGLERERGGASSGASDLPPDEIVTDAKTARSIFSSKMSKCKIAKERLNIMSGAEVPTKYTSKDATLSQLSRLRDVTTARDTHFRKCNAYGVRPTQYVVDCFALMKNSLAAEESNGRNCIEVDAANALVDVYNEFVKSVSPLVAERTKLINEINNYNVATRTSNEVAVSTWKRSVSMRDAAIIERNKRELLISKLEKELAACEAELVSIPDYPPDTRPTGKPQTCPSCSATVFVTRDGSLVIDACSPEEAAEHERQMNALLSKKKVATSVRNQKKLELDNVYKSGLPAIPEDVSNSPPEAKLLKSQMPPIWIPSPPPRASSKIVQKVQSNQGLLDLATSGYEDVNDAEISKAVATCNADLKTFEMKEMLIKHQSAHPTVNIDDAEFDKLAKTVEQAIVSLETAEVRLATMVTAVDEARKRAELLKSSVGKPPTIDARLNTLPELLMHVITFKNADYELTLANAELSAIDQKIATVTARMAACIEAHEFVVKERARYVELALVEIASAVNAVLERLFDGQVKYVLRPDDKDRIEAAIELNGRQEVDVSALSGGELDRFSIAVALAFAKFRGVPILIFDETLASQDEQRSLDCMNAVSDILGNRIVIFIAHGAQAQMFEKIIDIKNVLTGPTAKK